MSDLIIVGIAGSLRKGSYNRMLLEAAIDLAPEGMGVYRTRIDRVPLYNGDIEELGDPEPVTALKSSIYGADGVIFFSPEYNASIPAVMKNVIDWASRPYRSERDPRVGRPVSVMNGKPVSIVGATPGRLGTARMQNHMRVSLANMNAIVMPQPALMVMGANRLFNEAGDLIDDGTVNRLRKHLVAFGDWVRLLKNS